MRYRLVATVDGNISIDETTSRERDGILYEFLPNEQGKLAKVAVSLQIPTNKVLAFTNSITQEQIDAPASITVGGDQDLHAQLVAELQALESTLAFASISALKTIDWNNVEENFISESPEDDRLLAFKGFSTKYEYPTPSVRIATKALHNLIDLMPIYNSLYTAKAFWREGTNYFRSFQYVTAYYHFYFIIEDFYSGGKYGQKDVLVEFAKSTEFITIATQALREITADDRYRVKLQKFFVEENCEETPHGLQKLLYRVRGNLHHYYSKSPKTRGTPFNQKEYETISLVAMHVVTLAISYREADISTSLQT